MAEQLNGRVASFELDNLINRGYPTPDAVSVKLKAGQGILQRGTVVSGTAGGELEQLAAAVADGAAVYVVCDKVDTGTGAAVVAMAYRTGHFNRNRLLTKGSYKISAADDEAFRKSGILLDDAF